MKKLITENRRISMIQKVIDKCVSELFEWCDEEEYFDMDSAELCGSLQNLSKVEVRTLHDNTIGVIIYVDYVNDDYNDVGSVFYELGISVKNTIGDSFTLKLLNVVEE